jgi:Uri superfamily endonuclease
MFVEEDKAFIDCITSGVKARNHIDYVLESAKLLDALYSSADKKKEIEF